MNRQSGFTLIELIVVIVILGILGVTALAKYQDLSTEARQAAIQGVAAEISAGSALNYAKAVASGTAPVVIDGDIDDNLVGNLLTGGLPADMSVVGTPTCAGQAAGTAVSVTIKYDSYTTITATAQVICTG